MSDCVIRFGWNDSIPPSNINEFARFLKLQTNRIFIITSSIPEIYKLISKCLDEVFDEKNYTGKIGEDLLSVFKSATGIVPSSELVSWANKLSSLLQGISFAGDYSPALRDQILSFSEKVSASILSTLLKISEQNTQIILPEEYDFLVNDDFGCASHICFSERLREMPEGTIYIIPGSYGVTSASKIARSGANAADYTASSLTSWLGAPELILWGIEKRFLSADSKIIGDPLEIKRLTYAEASELAYFDHYSFHPRTIEPLEPKHIPIKIIRSDSQQVETIINTETFISKEVVKSVAYTDDIVLLKLDGPGVGLKPGILAKVTTSLSDLGINIKSVITSQVSINFILGKKEGIKALDLISQLELGSVKEINLVDKVSLIGIVGHGMQSNYGIAATIFSALAKANINIVLSGSGASDLVSYLVVKQSDRNKCIREIYKAFYCAIP